MYRIRHRNNWCNFADKDKYLLFRSYTFGSLGWKIDLRSNQINLVQLFTILKNLMRWQHIILLAHSYHNIRPLENGLDTIGILNITNETKQFSHLFPSVRFIPEMRRSMDHKRCWSLSLVTCAWCRLCSPSSTNKYRMSLRLPYGVWTTRVVNYAQPLPHMPPTISQPHFQERLTRLVIVSLPAIYILCMSALSIHSSLSCQLNFGNQENRWATQ